MPKYAHYNKATGHTTWYDTDFAEYTNLPPMDELQTVTDENWYKHLEGPHDHIDGLLIPFSYADKYKPSIMQQALAEIAKCDALALQLYKRGVPFPADWLEYEDKLKAIAYGDNSGATELPEAPPQPNTEKPGD